MRWLAVVAAELSATTTNVSENVGTWGAMSAAAGLFMFLMRRWAKQRDDAYQAAMDAEERVTARYEVQLAEMRAQHEAQLKVLSARHSAVEAALTRDVARLHSALSKVVNALVLDNMTAEDRSTLRTDVLRVLFPGQENVL
jgi:hypothetical protein